MGGGAQCEPEAGVEVDEGDDVSPRSIDVLLERIEGNTVARIASFESVRLPFAFLAFDRRDASGARDALRDDA